MNIESLQAAILTVSSGIITVLAQRRNLPQLTLPANIRTLLNHMEMLELWSCLNWVIKLHMN